MMYCKICQKRGHSFKKCFYLNKAFQKSNFGKNKLPNNRPCFAKTKQRAKNPEPTVTSSESNPEESTKQTHEFISSVDLGRSSKILKPKLRISKASQTDCIFLNDLQKEDFTRLTEKIRKLKKQVSDLRKENLSLNILYFTNFNHKKTERFFNNLPLLNKEN